MCVCGGFCGAAAVSVVRVHAMVLAKVDEHLTQLLVGVVVVVVVFDELLQ